MRPPESDQVTVKLSESFIVAVLGRWLDLMERRLLALDVVCAWDEPVSSRRGLRLVATPEAKRWVNQVVAVSMAHGHPVEVTSSSATQESSGDYPVLDRRKPLKG